MQRKDRGFTLVELNLAMVFVAILLLGIAAMTMHVTRIYERGMTIRNVNHIGREAVGLLQRDIAAANPTVARSIVDTNGHTGRLCLGSVSYLYNTAAGRSSASESQLFRTQPGSGMVSLVRILDPEQHWCAVGTRDIPTSLFTQGSASEIISHDRYRAIGVHHLQFTRYNSSSQQQALYSFSLRIGTSDLSAFNDAGQQCRPPTDNASRFESCFVTDFATVVKSGEIQEK